MILRSGSITEPPKNIENDDDDEMEKFLRLPEPLKLDGNVAENWRVFKQNFDVYATAIELSKKAEPIQVAIFLNACGSDATETFETFDLDIDSKKKYAEVVKAFEAYCAPKKNEVYEAFKFNSRNQERGETFDSFLLDLKKLVKNCGYQDKDRMIRDRIVMGINDDSLRKKLLEKDDLDLKKCIEMARSAEVTHKRANDMQKHTTQANVDAVQSRSNKRNKPFGTNSSNKSNNQSKGFDNKKSGNKIACKFCKSVHEYGKCPAFGKRCNNCSGLNHFSVACFGNKIREIKEQRPSLSSSDDEINIDMVTSSAIPRKKIRWHEKVRVNNCIIEFKLDTGADMNVLPLRFLKHMKNVKLDKYTGPVTGYTGHKLSHMGTVDLIVMCRNEVTMQTFLVVDTMAEPLLGKDACVEMGLVKRIDVIEDPKLRFIEKNRDIFDGLGCFVNDLEIKVRKNSKPVFKPARRIALSLRMRVKNELQRMMDRKIIEKVEGPVERASNLVIVEKKSGALRLCIDPQDLNDDILNENYMIPSFDTLAAKLSGKKVFSVFDLKEGFWQIGLSQEASELCTFNTPYGCYRFKRLPYGVKIGPEVFQKHNERNFSDIPGVFVYIDDVLIAADSMEEHDRILAQVLERARKLNIKFNESKVQYRVSEVKYMGKIISEGGISCDPERVEAIWKITAPKDKTDLQKLFGMINYVREYVPNLSEVSNPLRELLKSNVIFDWQKPHDDCLEQIKIMIANAPTLQSFDETKEVTIETDASKSGVGCCVMQEGKPIAFASRSLSDTEVGYAQVEKEMLAVVFSCKKFHHYIYGRNVTIRSDHKPLVSVIKKDIHKIPNARLQRMRLSLIKYRMNLIHVPGKELYVADLLSRYYNKEDNSPDIEDLNEFVHSINITDERIEDFKKALTEDKCLSELRKVLIDGWPHDKRHLTEEVKYYWKHRNDLILDNDLIFLNERVIVPTRLRANILAQLHASHGGIEKTKKRARTIVYWPGIDESIEKMITECAVCQKNRPKNVKEPMISHTAPDLPYQKLAMDICEYASKSYLVVSDYYSRFLDILPLSNKTAGQCIEKLKTCFATHGIPLEIVADNVPFGSREFRQFCSKNDIKIITTSPRYSQANGFAEKAVGIAKNLIKKTHEEKTELWRALLEYRNSPLKEVDASPAELLMSRKTRTMVPMSKKLFLPSVVPSIEKNITNKNQKCKDHYDRTAGVERSFEKGDKIWYHDDRHGWIKATIEDKHNTPRSYWIRLTNDTVLRRNSKWLRAR